MTKVEENSNIASLIPVHSESGNKNTISAKALYDFLGLSKAHWSKWAKKNIETNPYAIENEDWEGFTQEVNGNRTVDFEITIEFGKKLSMMAKTEKGEQARQYFLDCERKVSELAKPLSREEQLANAFLLAQEVIREKDIKIETQTQLLQLQAPKVENYDAIANTSSVFSLDDAGKVLGISGRRLSSLLKQTKFFAKNGKPYQKYIDEHFFVVKPVRLPYNDEVYMQPFVTGKGIDLLTSWYKTLNKPERNRKSLI